MELSVDLRVEHALRDELLKAKEKFHAKAASGLVSNVKTGEIVAMVSVPDFDPNNPKEAHDPDRINRLTTGVYEMGSTFKSFTLAMALDSGKYDLNSMWDARGPLHYGKFAIHDDHALGRMINMKEVFYYSSNVGAARIAMSQGVEAHKAFLRKLGQLDRLLQAVGGKACTMEIGEPLIVEPLLHAGDALVVDIDETDQMRDFGAGGIDALVLAQEADAGNAEAVDFLLLLRRDFTLQPHKTLARGNAIADFADIEIRQGRGQQLDRFVLVDDTARLGK